MNIAGYLLRAEAAKIGKDILPYYQNISSFVTDDGATAHMIISCDGYSAIVNDIDLTLTLNDVSGRIDDAVRFLANKASQ